jgi:hypothetical protein
MKKGYVHEGDDWVQGGEVITSPEKLAKIAAVVERTVLIVEHRHYRGASSPTRRFFEEQEEFLKYLNDHARPGDAFRAWAFDLCTESNAIATGKYPDEIGRVPLKGAY